MAWLPDWITGFDRENYERGLEADRKNRALTDNLRERGLITDDDYNTAIRHYDDSLTYDPDAEIEREFAVGFEEGADNIRNFAGDTINTVVGTPLKLIPWQVWLALAAFLAFKLGLLDGIVKKWK